MFMRISLRPCRSRTFCSLSLVMLLCAWWLVACADVKLPFIQTDKIDPTELAPLSNARPLEGPRLNTTEMVGFIDPTAGFEARVPLHWSRALLNTPEDAGITVSFESPQSDEADMFADYLMIDIQPGSVVEVLEEQPDERTLMSVAGESVYRERISLDQHPVADTHIDLVAWQLTLRKPGYSIAIYVVGERREEARLERVLIEFAYSFSMPVPPFLLT